MRLPTYDELIDEQRDVIDTPLDEDQFVAGPPGSGKTVLAVQRAQAVDEFGSAFLITYNRMLRRLMAQLGAPDSRTMQSLVWNDYDHRTGGPPPRSPWDSHEYQWTEMLDTLRGHRSAGHTHGHVVIDEGQDLASHFFTYARRHVSPRLSVFADEDQALRAHGTTLEQIKAHAVLPDPIILSVNHRNTEPIADLAEHFHRGRLPHATVQRRGGSAGRPQLMVTAGLDDTCQRIANWYVNRRGSVGVIVSSNDTGKTVQLRLWRYLPEGTRVDCYRSSDRNEDAIDLLAPGITIVNRRSAKGQEFDAVFMLELGQFLPCRTQQMHRVMYMLCTRARDHLFLVDEGRSLSAAAHAALPDSLVERT